MKSRLLVSVLLGMMYILLILPSPALAAASYYVSPDGNDVTGTGEEGNPWRTISYAVDIAAEGDTILVMDDDNEATDDYIEDIQITKSLTIERYDTNGPNPQVKAASQGAHTFEIVSGDVTINGLDIHGDGAGAGIFLIGVTGCTIENCRLGWDATHNNEHGVLAVSCSDILITINTVNNNLRHGIYLYDSIKNVIFTNTVDYNAEDGICLESGASSNLIISNNATGNQYGIFMTFCENNTFISNVLNQNDGRIDGDGIMLDNSSDSTLVNNTMSGNPGDGIEYYNCSNTNISGNTITGNAWGVRLNMTSSNNILTRNTITGNNKGIAVQASSDNNQMYLNTLSGNVEDNGMVEGSTGNVWQSPTSLSYLDTKGYLGNYYGDYSGNDANGDSVGDSPYSGSGFVDMYPLMQQQNAYSLMTWFLDDLTMYVDDPAMNGGINTINAGGTGIWVADAKAQQGTVYPAGATDNQTCWTYQVSFSESFEASAFTLTMGYADSDGSNFNTPDGKPNVTLSGTGSTFSGVLTNTGSFTVPAGKYLALKITNNSDTPRSIMYGGSRSYLSAPTGITLVDSIQGDVNGDGTVTVLDVTEVVKTILQRIEETPGADANQDGNVNVLDVTVIIKIILDIGI